MSKPTKEQIQTWKEEFGSIYELESEGMKCWIKDPVSSLQIVQKAIIAERDGGDIQYTVSILNDCWLQGDEKFRTVEKYANGLTDQIAELVTLPEFKIDDRKDTEAFYKVTVEEKSLRCKLAMRADIIEAETKNIQGKPFQTAVNLLNIIAIDKKELDEVKKDNRVYMGFLRATNQLKDKAFVSVKKL